MADVYAARHHITIQNYLEDVVLQSLTNIDERKVGLEKSEDDFALFWISDLDEVKREAMKAFALSIQSIWERQFRAYLLKSSEELAPQENSKRVHNANWAQLCTLFEIRRGISIKEFPCFYALDDLQNLGNACRHGDGKSAQKLYQSRPDIWLSPPVDIPEFGISFSRKDWTSVDRMEIRIEHLREFVQAIAEFWRDVGYIYRESIEQRHPDMEDALKLERESRTWTPVGVRQQ